MKNGASLYHQELRVAELSEVHEHQGTWFGVYRLVMGPDGEGHAQKLRDFVSFCVSWNAHQSGSDAPVAEDFDRVMGVLAGGWWFSSPGVQRMAIAQAPNFLAADEVSWVVA